MFFNPGDRVLFRLRKGYMIPKATELQKYQPQYTRPFQIITQIGREAHRLDFPTS